MRIGMMEFLVALMLLVLGAVFGSLSPKNPFFNVDISNVFEILSSVGTIVAAIVAIPALNSWRKQFKHGEKIRRLEGLRTIDGAFAALYSLCDAHSQFQACKFRGGETSVFAEAVSKAQSQYFERETEYSKSWRDAVIIMDAKESESYRWTPDKLSGLFLEVVTAIATIQNNCFDSAFDAKNSPVLLLIQEHNLSRASLRQAIVEAREDIDNLIKVNIL